MTQKKTTPLIGIINFDFQEDIFRMIANGAVKNHSMECVLSYPEKPLEVKRKINVVITEVILPGTMKDLLSDTKEEVLEMIPDKKIQALNRSNYYLFDTILKQYLWVLIGNIAERPDILIFISFFPEANIGTYSFEKKTQKPVDPQMN